MTLTIPVTQSITLPDAWQACKTPQELSYWIIARLEDDEADISDIQAAVTALQASISTISAQAAAAEAAANQANTVSNAAQVAAEDAQTDAASAQTVASAAQTTANTAQTTANNANVLANSANTWITDQVINLTLDGNFSFVVSNTWTPQYINGRVLVFPLISASALKTNLFANFVARLPTLVPTPGTSFYIAFNGTLPSDTDIDDLVPSYCSNGVAIQLSTLTANSIIKIVRASNINASGETFRWVPVVWGD